MKKIWQYFTPGTNIYVLLHGIGRKMQKKGLSATFEDEKNPKQAFKRALREMDQFAILLPLLPEAKECPVRLLEGLAAYISLKFPFEWRMSRFGCYKVMRQLFTQAKERTLDERERLFLILMRQEVELDKQSFANADDGEEAAYGSCVDDLNTLDTILK